MLSFKSVIECGRGGWAGQGGAIGGKWGQLQLNNSKNLKK